MKPYRIVFGAYVRMYADHTVHAETDDAARQRAIDEFKARGRELDWIDADYDNLAQPSIVSMQCDDPPGDVLEGYDFPATEADAHDYAADKLLAALSNLMPDVESEIHRRRHRGLAEEWIELDRKAADARAAIAEANCLPIRRR